ncbi:hypothetical protein [Streptomyces asiaticus]|uniref:hypothetical protein n=1 Tax=Streptomyces asiaticus TaxID=114695 RepID=UPI003F6767FC
MDGPPTHLRALDPDRYRDVAVQALRDHPADAWVAAVAVWRAWQDEAVDWQADRGMVWGVKGWKKQLGSGRPPMGWVLEEFGLSNEGGGMPCPPNCHTHHRHSRRR